MDYPSHVPNAAQAGATGSQRAVERDSLLLTAPFRVAGRAVVQVRVRNLSPSGLMAEYPNPLTRGTVVAVEVRGVGWVPGHVAWCAEGRIGVAFDYDIDPRLARKPVGHGARTPEYAKPVLDSGTHL